MIDTMLEVLEEPKAETYYYKFCFFKKDETGIGIKYYERNEDDQNWRQTSEYSFSQARYYGKPVNKK